METASKAEHLSCSVPGRCASMQLPAHSPLSFTSLFFVFCNSNMISVGLCLLHPTPNTQHNSCSRCWQCGSLGTRHWQAEDPVPSSDLLGHFTKVMSLYFSSYPLAYLCWKLHGRVVYQGLGTTRFWSTAIIGAIIFCLSFYTVGQIDKMEINTQIHPMSNPYLRTSYNSDAIMPRCLLSNWGI